MKEYSRNACIGQALGAFDDMLKALRAMERLDSNVSLRADLRYALGKLGKCRNALERIGDYKILEEPNSPRQ